MLHKGKTLKIGNIRSDILPLLRNILNNSSVLKDIAPIEQFEIILDANIVLKDIMWMAKRNNPLAKSDLQELLHSETIVALAPTFLKEEVEKYLPVLSKEKKIKLSLMMEEWNKYQERITFYEITVEEYEKENARDPKDLPYIKLQEATGAVIHTKDKDIAAMGGSVIKYSIITNLRDYSRDSAIEYTLKIGGVFTAHVTDALIKMSWSLIQKIFSGINELPKWVHWTAIGLLILILINKDSRNKLILISSAFFTNTGTLLNDIIKEIEPMTIAHEKSKTKALKNLEIAQDCFYNTKYQKIILSK